MSLAITESELRQLLSQASFLQHYGFELDSFADGECALRVPFQKAFERPGGVVSGQVFMAAADVAIWLAIMTRLGDENQFSPRRARGRLRVPREERQSRRKTPGPSHHHLHPSNLM
jgi:acyl-coenzyme A thioesterase PaaI-like protein